MQKANRVLARCFRSCFAIVTSAALLFLSGCAALLAAEKNEAPDLSVVVAGASRAQIEQQLGTPISDVRAEWRTGADRIAQYTFAVRENQDPQASTYQQFVDSMIAFHQEMVTVHYGTDDKAMKVIHERVVNPAARARLSRTTY